MLVSGSRHSSFRARSVRLFFAVALAAASGGGCTLLVGSELSEKPTEGAGGQGGDGSTASQSSSAMSSSAMSSSAMSSSAMSSSGTGWLMCKEGTADCDGFFVNGCEAKLKSDAKNCGVCKHACPLGGKCADGKCE
jgi:hypothetical protein